MARARLKFNDREWRKFLQKMRIRVTKQSPNLLQVAYSTAGFRDIIKHFKEERGPEASWPRRKDKKTHGLLKDTGNLRNSILTFARRLSRFSVIIFALAPYSGVHDRGSRKRNIPKREFMWFSDRAKEFMSRIVLRKVTR